MVTECAPTLSEPEFTFPPEEGEMVAREYARATSILEYGSGGSTVLAARSTDAQVLSIESDKSWAQNLSAFLAAENLGTGRVSVHWENVGPTGKWGYPTDRTKWRKYPSYAFSAWEKYDVAPDVVLIDGRFRLACFAATLLFAKKPTVVLFDDFVPRQSYHAATTFADPVSTSGRMAKFIIKPNTYSGSEFAAMVRWFFIVK